MKSLENKIVYITGGSSGIGLETAKLVFAAGAHLVVMGRDKDKLHRAVKAIDQHRVVSTQKLETVSLDVSNYKDVKAVLSNVLEDSGTPDFLVTSAGIGSGDYFENISYEEFDRVIKTNLYGVRNVIACVLIRMKKKGGKIVIVSSLAGLTGMIGYSAYATSKFALVGFAECIRPELKRFNIEVTLVCPPEVATPLVVEEARTLPPESRAIKNLAGQLSVESAGKAVLKAMTGRSFLVIPGLMAKASYLMIRLLPGFLVRRVNDAVIASTRRSETSENEY